MSDDTSRIDRAANALHNTALNYGVILTPLSAGSLCPLSTDMSSELEAMLSRRVSSLQKICEELILDPGSAVSEYLTTASLHRFQQELQSVLHGLFQGFRLHDVRPEVLMTWLAEIQSQASSSARGGESGKEVTTPSRAETVATSGDAALQPGTHGTGEDA